MRSNNSAIAPFHDCTARPSHPSATASALQLRQNLILPRMSAAQWAELEPLLAIADYRKGDPLVRQGDEEMEQFFILDGMLKRVVSNPQGKEMILRFAAETEMDTSYAAWRLRTPVPYSIVARDQGAHRRDAAAAVGRVPRAPPEIKLRFEYEVMRLMSEVMAHTITLHLLDAPGRLARFQRKHPELVGPHPEEGARRLPQPDAGDALAPQAEARRTWHCRAAQDQRSGQKSSTQRERR